MSIGLVGLRGLRGLGKSGKLSNAQRTFKRMFADGTLLDFLAPANYTQTEARASGALGWSGETLGTNVLARRLVNMVPGVQLNEVFIESSTTRINDADISNWACSASAGNTSTCADQGGGVYRLVQNCPGGTWGAQALDPVRTITLGNTYTCSCQARLVSGDPGNISLRVADASDYTVMGNVSMATMTSDWQWFKVTFVAPDTDARPQLKNLGTASKSCTYEVRYVQMTETTYRKRFVPGAGAGVTMAEERLDVTAAIGDAVGLYAIVAPYNHGLAVSPNWTTGVLKSDATNHGNLYYSQSGDKWKGETASQLLEYAENPPADERAMVGLEWDYGGAGASYLYRGATLRDTTVIASAPAIAQVTVGKYGATADSQCEGPISVVYAPNGLTDEQRAALAEVVGDGEVQDYGSYL